MEVLDGPRLGTCDCGTTFPLAAIGRPRLYCSPECRAQRSRDRRRRSVCRNCQREFTHVAAKVRFCPDCRYVARSLPERGRALLVIDDQEVLRCSKCHQHRPADEFPRSTSYKHGRVTWCKPCYKVYNADRADRTLEMSRRQKYGISVLAQREMWSAQSGRCVSCGYVFKSLGDAHLDHDHVTGRVRAFLCAPCNQIVGRCGEDIHHLVAVAEYLIAQKGL